MRQSVAITVEIARHELEVLLRTKRAVAMALIYLGAAVFGGLAYVLVLRSIEQGAIKLMIDRGASAVQAAGAVSVAGAQAYQSILSFVAGAKLDALAPSLRNSVILPVFLWSSLAFLPFLVLLTSFDQVAGDLQSRSICYSILRASRASILLGKALAQAVVFVLLTIVSSVVLLVLAAGLLRTFSVTDTLPGLVRLWLLLIPFGLCYLGISAFSSTLTRQPFAALLDAVGILVLLRVLGWLVHIPADATAAPLRYLHWLSPATYQHGFWLGGVLHPSLSALAYLVFAGVFLLLAVWRLGRRDL